MFPETGSRIGAIPADFAGAAGATFGVSSWTELWAFRHEGHMRLWEEMTPIPNRRSLRIVDSYAGFTGDAPVLEPLWTRALDGDRLDDDLPVYANGKLWAFIDTGVEAQQRGWLGDPREMDAYYREQAETLRPGTFARLHLNQWQSGEEAFINGGGLGRVRRPVHAAAGVPGHDRPGGAARRRRCRHEARQQRRRRGRDAGGAVASHPSPHLVAGARRNARPGSRRWRRSCSTLRSDFPVAAVRYDPSQMVRSAQTLRGALPMQEFPQSSANLTTAGTDAL